MPNKGELNNSMNTPPNKIIEEKKVKVLIDTMLNCVGARSQFLDSLKHFRQCKKCQQWVKDEQQKLLKCQKKSKRK